MSYVINYGESFLPDIKKFPKVHLKKLRRYIERLSSDPFSFGAKARRLKDRHLKGLSRLRIGDDFRLLFFVKKDESVTLMGLKKREIVYQPANSPIRREIQDEDKREIISGLVTGVPIGGIDDTEESNNSSYTRSDDEAQDSESTLIEDVDWLNEELLELIKIPQEYWALIEGARDFESLQKKELPEIWLNRVEDFLTNPDPSRWQKLYKLSTEQTIDDLAELSLVELLIELDKDQKKALDRMTNEGPYLIKGSAGTGKTLIGLYFIKNMIMNRSSESLFDLDEARFGVMSYTSALSKVNKEVIESITPSLSHDKLDCRTLDQHTYELSQVGISGFNIMMDREYGKFLKDASNHCSEEARKTLNILGVDYLVEEIEQIIFGNNLIRLDDYLSVERRGRKRGLNAKERENIWELFEKFKEVTHSEKKTTWGWIRVNALEKLKRDPKPRFNALFVDEAQDLSKVARQICLALVKSEKNIVFAADTGQSIYAVPSSWVQVDPRLDFRKKRPILLTKGYRTTYEINSAIAFLRNDPGDEEDASSNAKSVFHGDFPNWLSVPQNEMISKVVEVIESLDTNPDSRINKGHIAIIVRTHKHQKEISEALSKEGYEVNAVSKYKSVDLESQVIHVLTAHASKGLGFPVVIVPFVDRGVYPPSFALASARDEGQLEQVMENEQRLLYVALSRASHKLFMLSDSDNPSPLLKKLDNAYWLIA